MYWSEAKRPQLTKLWLAHVCWCLIINTSKRKGGTETSGGVKVWTIFASYERGQKSEVELEFFLMKSEKETSIYSTQITASFFVTLRLSKVIHHCRRMRGSIDLQYRWRQRFDCYLWRKQAELLNGSSVHLMTSTPWTEEMQTICLSRNRTRRFCLLSSSSLSPEHTWMSLFPLHIKVTFTD